MTDLSINSFEAALAQVGNVAHPANQKGTPEPIDHIVLNCRNNLSDVVDAIKAEIAKTTDKTKLLYGLDLRVIYHREGKPENWSLEACSKTKSLGIVGQRPTA